MDGSHEASDAHGDDDAEDETGGERPVICTGLGYEAGEGAGQHHTLDTDVDDSGPFAQDSAEGSKDERHCCAQCEVEGADSEKDAQPGLLFERGEIDQDRHDDQRKCHDHGVAVASAQAIEGRNGCVRAHVPPQLVLTAEPAS